MDRNTAYAILSDLIFNGFLSASMSISGSTFVFKTLTGREIDLLKVYLGKSAGGSFRDALLSRYFAVFSIFSIDGRNILSEREALFNQLLGFLGEIPEKLFGQIINGLNALREEEFEAIKFLEGFCYTALSRRLWRVHRGHMPNEESITGIPGTCKLGVNVHQENWVSINRMLDSEEEYNRNFSMALLVASASNPKGVRRISSQHDLRIHTSEERREKLAREGFIDTDKPVTGWAAPVDTVEELVAELERQMGGKKDKHDIFIEEHMKRLREEGERKRREAETRIRSLRESRSDGNRLISGEQRALTPEETAQLMSRKRSGLANAVPENAVTPEDKDRFMKKIGSRVLTGRRK